MSAIPMPGAPRRAWAGNQPKREPFTLYRRSTVGFGAGDIALLLRNGDVMHALIIEDEAMIAATIEFVLRECGFESFDIAPSSQMAINAARARRPDLVTADVQLGRGSGIEAVQAIRTQGPVPVIYITASARDVRERLDDHAVIDKPFSQETLAYAVAASLS